MKTFRSPNLGRALDLAHDILIIDGHIDVPYWMAEVYKEDISAATIGGDFDYPRARKGRLDAAFMSIYVPVRFQKSGGARDYANGLIDVVEGFVASHPTKFGSAITPADIRENHNAGLVSMPIGIENGVAIEEDLRNLEHFFDRGVRYMTLVHAADNLICDSSYDKSGTWGGISDFGGDVVREMDRLGMIVDVSHVSDNAFFDVLKVASRPLVATHSSARAFTPDWERNMSDELIRALASTGGVVMINFGSDFLDREYDVVSTRLRKRINKRIEKKGLERFSDEGFRMFSEFRKANPVGSVTDVVRHIKHVAQLVGVDHVGLGSDFDGVFSLPVGLQDVGDYPNLIAALLDDGFSDDDVRKICGENFMRVWQQIETSVGSDN
ncbi:MAG: membrane dipeptidase [Rhodothermales bacterium]|nr:membrane dipeptidase [Rhodothermales bacterium]